MEYREGDGIVLAGGSWRRAIEWRCGESGSDVSVEGGSEACGPRARLLSKRTGQQVERDAKEQPCRTIQLIQNTAREETLTKTNVTLYSSRLKSLVPPPLASTKATLAVRKRRVLPLLLTRLLLVTLCFAFRVLDRIVDGLESQCRLAFVATFSRLLTNLSVHGRVGGGADLGLEKLLNLVSERLEFDCEGAKKVSGGACVRSDLRESRTHLRILSVGILGNAEDGSGHLHQETLESSLVEMRDNGGEEAKDRGRLKRPRTLRERRRELASLHRSRERERNLLE